LWRKSHKLKTRNRLADAACSAYFSAPVLFINYLPVRITVFKLLTALTPNGDTGKQISFAKYIEKWIRKAPPPFDKAFRRIQQGRLSLLQIFAVFFKKEKFLLTLSDII